MILFQGNATGGGKVVEITLLPHRPSCSAEAVSSVWAGAQEDGGGRDDGGAAIGGNP